MNTDLDRATAHACAQAMSEQYREIIEAWLVGSRARRSPSIQPSRSVLTRLGLARLRLASASSSDDALHVPLRAGLYGARDYSRGGADGPDRARDQPGAPFVAAVIDLEASVGQLAEGR